MVLILRINISPLSKLAAEIYTLGRDSWRAVLAISPSIDFLYPNRLSGVSEYRDIYWLFGYIIKSSDFRKEEFNETPVPDFGYRHYKWLELVNLKGSLLLLLSFHLLNKWRYGC